RISAAKWALEKFGVTVFVLDDGFQHRKVRRDLDIVCIDATNPFGNGKMLPAGILREPINGFRRADAVVITRAHLIPNVEEIVGQIRSCNEECRIFLSENLVSNVRTLEEFHAQTQRTQNKTIKEKGLAFCALGNPSNFFDQLRQNNFKLVQTKTFSDHHFYSQEDVSILEKIANESGAEVFLTTAKDAVKLKDLKFEIPCLVVEIEVKIDDEKGFRALVNAS
ncbi:MAG: tetraacyldisaccharide 4'-kinase, partial [Acidobacteriota bacterium]|nr:tetraacyldisaccharide 4'-kinase [Acidobacteriota bacterium]